MLILSYLGRPLSPDKAYGYAHHITQTFYIHRGRIYRVPSSEKEYARFSIIESSERSTGLKLYKDSIPRYPLRLLERDNVYYGRDSEQTLMVMRRIITEEKTLQHDWQKIYRDIVRNSSRISRKKDWRRRPFRRPWRP